jgi:hypothetical protein
LACQVLTAYGIRQFFKIIIFVIIEIACGLEPTVLNAAVLNKLFFLAQVLLMFAPEVDPNVAPVKIYHKIASLQMDLCKKY